MKRTYTDVAAFRAPYRSPNVSFAGLGASHAAYDANHWPAGRTYWSTHFYRAPYQAGYYQSGALRGLGDAAWSGAGVAVLIVGTIVIGLMKDKLSKLASAADVQALNR